MNINNIGVFIGELRREADMTQSEMADILHVSHQAISKWERLESLPDITMLPELAKLFNITIDELLRGERQVIGANGPEETEHLIKNIAMQQVDEAKNALKTLDHAEEFLKEIAPITKPKVLRDIMNGIEIDLESIEEFLPFLGSDLLDEIIDKVIANKTFETLHSGIYPFLKHSHKDKLIESCMKADREWDDIENIYPFLNVSQKEKLVIYFIEKNEIGKLEELYPFISNELKDILIDLMIEKGLFNHVEDLMPFLTTLQRDKVIDAALENNIGKGILSGWAPFLNQQQLGKIIMRVRSL